jgi:hypothetical protein
MSNDALKSKILLNVEKDPDPDGCWLWQGYCNKNGYGQIWWEGKQHLTHRMSYQAFIGDIPESIFVLHWCDVRKCCNPKHLFLGTQTDNIRDRVNKGRCKGGENKGEKHGRAKLTKEQVLKILASNEKQKTLAERYCVDPSTISMIKTGKNWKHL